jgi:hypothetical protein
VLDRPRDEQGRLALAQGATMAGIAFSNSMVGLVHSLGHSVGALCHVHHGTCMSILLPAVLEYNLEARRAEIGELLLPLAGAEVYADTPADESRREDDRQAARAQGRDPRALRAPAHAVRDRQGRAVAAAEDRRDVARRRLDHLQPGRGQPRGGARGPRAGLVRSILRGHSSSGGVSP